MHTQAFQIHYEDEAIIVLNKIAKILIEPSPRKEKTTLTTLLAQKQGQPVYPCHRLDRETTGLIVYAKTRLVQEAIMDEFRQKRVSKRYAAIVKGHITPRSGILRGRIIDKLGAHYHEKPKLAVTTYKTIRAYEAFSLIELTPQTGRTNQLRIQLATIGHPILGERMYAFGKDFIVRFKRLALHANFIAFKHPTNHKNLSFSLPLPNDIEIFLRSER